MKILDGLHGFFWTSYQVNNCNTFLVDRGARILIDPGHLRLVDHVVTGLRQVGLRVEDIDLVICTHGHPDHLESAKVFKSAGALFAMHAKDWELCREVAISLGSSVDLEDLAPDFFLQEGELVVKDLRLDVIHTPGHSPGSICLYWKEEKALFTGDVIFRDGLGRTDLPGGNGEELKQSIRRISRLEVEWLLPGHGDFIAGSKEVQRNFSRVEQFWFAYI